MSATVLADVVTPPSYIITGTNTTDNWVTVANHGLRDGDVVEYEYTGLHPIGGLETGYLEPQLDENGDPILVLVRRQYTVLRMDANSVAFGSTFDTRGTTSGGAVDETQDTITIGGHAFQTGDWVVPTDTLAGLTAGGRYRVVVVDDHTIRLVPEAYVDDDASFTPGNVSRAARSR